MVLYRLIEKCDIYLTILMPLLVSGLTEFSDKRIHIKRNVTDEKFVDVERRSLNIPPRPNYTHALTAKPDPFETSDPTTQAKVLIRSDLFSNENGEILYYALLITEEIYSEAPKSGFHDISEGWPKIPNWEKKNTSYQVTPIKWNPFNLSIVSESKLVIVSYILGDDTCSDDNYCNKPLERHSKYVLKIRAFTQFGYQDTDVIYFETLDNLPVYKILLILGVLFVITVAAVCLSIFNLECIKSLGCLNRNGRRDSFSPVPEPLSQKAFLKYAKELLGTPGRLGNEYHLLGTLSSDVSTLCLCAQRHCNRDKNRYVNILPFDITRVKLSVLNDDPSTDYINASFIKGYSNKVNYIASQGPMKETLYDFFRMVLEQNIELIVMLTELCDNGKEKCFKYFPDVGSSLKIKNIKVLCKSEVSQDNCIKRLLDISSDQQKKISVTHMHYKKWKDFDSPSSVQEMVKFFDQINKVEHKGYMLVHCSAGAGRTGTFIAIDILMHRLRNNEKISVLETILKLRKERVNMVQTDSQLKFIYQFLVYIIENQPNNVKKSLEV